jgi:fibronectin-binding autotransporter adhesin
MKTKNTAGPLLLINRLLPGLCVAGLAIFAAVPEATAQFDLTSSNYTQNFNGLGTNTTNVTAGNLNNLTNTLNGWFFLETGATTNSTITAGTGSSASGDTYNFGTAGGSDRSLGGLAVNATVPSWGFWFSNSLGSTITNLRIAYTGETWRVAVANRSDNILFSYSGTNTALSAATWTNDASLGYTNVATNTTGSGSLQQSTAISNNLAVSIASGATFFIRWLDNNISGNDDGMSINNFSLTAVIQQVVAVLNWAGGSGNWDTGFAGTVTNGATLSFSGAGGIATNNLTDPLIASMIFSNGAGSYTVAGNAFTISNGIVNNSANGQTFSNAIRLGAAQTFDAAAGNFTFAGDITNGGNLLTIAGASNTVVSGAISGAAGLTKSGNGTLTLNAPNSFVGAVTINGGVLSIDANGELGDAANDITLGGGTLATTASLGMAATRDLSGSGTLDIAGGTTLTNTGTVNMTALTLTNTGTFEMSGSSKTINALTFNSAATLANTGAVALLTGSVAANHTAGTVVMAGGYDLGTTNRTFTVSDGSAAVDMQLTGAITNTNPGGYIIKQGAGRLEVTGNNVGLLGGLQLGTAGSAAAGQLLVGAGSAFGSGSFRFNSGTLEATTALTGVSAITNAYSIGGRDANAAILGGTNAIELSGAGSWFTQTSNATSHVTVNNVSTLSGVLGATTNTGVNILLSGSGTLTLGGASANTFTNALTISNSGLTLVASKDGALGTAASGTTVQSGSTIVLSNVNYATTEALNISGTGVGGNGALRATGTSTYAGAVTAGATTTIAADSSASLTISGALAGGGNTVTVGGAGNTLLSGAVTGGSLTKSGAGTLTISNASTSFSTLTTGTGETAIATNATVTGLAGSGALNLTGGTLTVNASAAQTYSGALAGSGALVKTGANTLTFSGSGSTHNGTITVTNGTVVANANLSGSTVSVGNASTPNGSVLMGTGSVGATTINTNGRISPGNSVGTLSVSNSLTLNGGGSYLWEINGTNGPAGTTWDLLTVDTAATGDGLGSLVLPGSGQFSVNGAAIDGFTFDGTQSYTNNYFLITKAANISGSLANLAFVGSGLGSGGWTFSTNSTGLFLNYEAAVSILFTNTGSAFQGDANIATPAGPWGLISGVKSVTVGGGGTVVMTNSANSYVGSTAVTNGVLAAAVNALNGVAGAFGNAVTAILVGATNGTATAGLDISADGVTNGRAVTVVAGSSGTKTIGTSLANGTATYSGNVLLNDAAELTSGGTANAVFSGVLSGAGAVTKVGTGTVLLSASNSYAGGTTINAGTVQIDGANRLGATSGALTINNGKLQLTTTSLSSGRDIVLGNANSAIEVDSGLRYTATNTSIISGGGTLNKLGAGTLSLYGTNTYSGGNVVAAGTLEGDTTSLKGAIANDATVVFLQTTNGTYSSALSGIGTFVKQNAGTLTLGGSNSYTGGTLVSTGGLIGSTTSLQGAITNNAAVSFDQTTNGTYAGAMSGTGSLTKSGTGSVTLSASNSYNGGTTVGAGALVAATNGALGTGAVTMTNGSVVAKDGVTIANAFTIGVSAVNTTNFGSTTVLAGWDFSAVTGAGTNNMKAGTLASGVVNGTGLTRGSGVIVPGSPAARAWGGESWNSASQSAAITANDFVTFTLAADPSTVLRFDSVNPFNYRRSGTGAPNGALQFSTDGVNFTDITSSISYSSTSNSGSSVASISLSSIADLSSGTTLTFRIVNWGATSAAGTWYLYDTDLSAAVDFGIRGQVGTLVNTPASGTGTLGIEEAGLATFTGNVTVNNTATLTAATGGTATFSNVISGPGSAITKTGDGTVTFSGASANTFAGTTTVSAGTLKLDKTATNTAAIAGNLVVNTGATLLLSKSEQVANTSAVTLSGGTITRGSGVNETFGTLNITGGSTLDNTSGTAGTLRFGVYEGGLTPGVGDKLTINGFSLGNVLIFGNNIGSTDGGLGLLPTSGGVNDGFFDNSYFAFNGMEASSFGGFRTSWNSGTSTFTITSVPEPSTYVAAAGLLALMGWPMRRRLVRDAQSILGLRAPMRDRLARKA